MVLKAAACSDPGPVRSGNEDRCLVRTDRNLFLVADGVGGLGQGDMAAELACKTVLQWVLQATPLPQAVIKAHRALQRLAASKPGSPLGTTLVALDLSKAPGLLVWAGDSRCYRWRREQLQPLTHDHSFVQGLLSAGAIDEQEARTHPQRNVITRALGQKLDKLSCRSIHLHPGDRYLLCTDGIHGVLDDNTLQIVLEEYDDPEICAQALVDTALGAGAQDNLTALVVNVEPDS